MEQESVCPCAPTQWDSGANKRVVLRAFTVASWALAVVATKPTIWEPSHLPASIFTMDVTMLDIFWISLSTMQAAYICYTFLTIAQLTAISVLFEPDLLFAEVVLVVNFFNLLTLYFSGYKVPKFHHASVISGPLSWTIVAIYWNGFMMVPHPESLIAGVLGIVCMCGILGTGMFFAVQYSDYTITYSLSLLSSAVAVGQYRLMNTDIPSRHSMEFIVVLVQCIFALVVMAALFVLSGAMVIAQMVRYRCERKQNHQSDAEKSVSNLEC